MSKSKDANAVKAVLDYLNKQNRPYSAIDICNNLHKEYGKTAIVKACESLAESGSIKEKVYGKQKVYVADQSQFPDVNDEEISEMDHNVTELTERVKSAMEDVRHLESEQKGLNSCLTTQEAETQLKDITNQCSQYHAKLKALKEGGNVVSPAEKERVYNCHGKYVKEWRKRKRISNDMLDAILEGYPKTKKQLYEEVGIETDEEYGVTPPDVGR